MTVERWQNLEEAARDAYAAYSANGGVTMTVAWDALPQPVKRAWEAVVRKLLAKAYRIMAHDLIAHIHQDAEANAGALEGKVRN